MMSRLDASYLLLVLVHGLIRLHAAKQWAARSKPSAIVVEFDRNENTAPLVLAAKAQGVPVITFQHGMVNSRYGYLPLLADKIFVWGELTAAKLIAYGLEADRIEITGRPGLTDAREILHQVEEKKKNQGISQRWKVLLCTNSWPLPERLRNLDAFIALDDLKLGVDLVIRPHPDEKMGFYVSRVEENEVKVVSAGKVPLHISLSSADILICKDSGVGEEAMQYGIPVIVLNLAKQSLKGSAAWISSGAAVAVHSFTELRDEVSRLVEDHEYRVGRQLASRQYGKKVFSLDGLCAAEAAANRIRVVAGLV